MDLNTPGNNDSPRAILASFLLFLGPLVAGGGFLAMWRTGQRSLFFIVLIPIGTIMWLVGLVMRLRQPG